MIEYMYIMLIMFNLPGIPVREHDRDHVSICDIHVIIHVCRILIRMRNRPLEFCARFVRRGVWCGKLGSFMAEFEIPLLSESSHQAIETSFSRSDIIELADGKSFI